MTCECNKYQPIQLRRKDISDRIKISRKLKKQLTQIAKHNDEHNLYMCKVCGQLWQGSRAWNWGNDEYLFKVPQIDIDDWIYEPYMCPDEMLIYSAVMGDYYEKNSFRITETNCQEPDCFEKAVVNSVLCKKHFIENLQLVGILPKRPSGRLFAPYYINSSE